MNITKVVVGRTFNLGNFQSLRLELEADVDNGDSKVETVHYLNRQLNALKESLGSEYVRAKAIVDRAENFSKAEVSQAQKLVKDFHTKAGWE